MKKTLHLSTIATLALLSLVSVGCGGGGSGTSSSANTGTGYYVDSAVAGVDYVCGTQKGKTDKDGKFTFEESKECSFSLADIPLRTTPASDLLDGKKIFENDLKVAKFLQSIDVDGNLSNGIQITDEVITAVTKALKENDVSTNSVPEGQDLADVVASVSDDIGTISADVPTDEAVQIHLENTQTDITKELFAGKTFYAYYKEDSGTRCVAEVKVNSTATNWTYKDIIGCTGSGSEEIIINGTQLSINHPEEEDLDVYTVSEKEKYILLSNTHGSSKLKFYFKKADAEAALGDSGTGSDDLKDLKFSTEYLNGKTFYTLNKNSTNNNGSTPEICILEQTYTDTTFTQKEWVYHSKDNWTEGCNEDFGNWVNSPYSISNDGKIVWAEGLEFELKRVDKDKLLVKDPDGISPWYYNKADAEAALGDSGTGSDDLKFTTEYLNGKTFITVQESDNNKPSGCWTFNEDKSIDVISKKDGIKKEFHGSNANWHIIENDKLTFIIEGSNYQTWEITGKSEDFYIFTNKWYDTNGNLDDTDITRRIKEVETCPLSELVND